MMNNLAIIPARSGSKELKNKNVKLLNGKPMMAYTIEAAIESGMFTHIHVSTDSQQYAQIAMEYGAEVPFLRTANYADDTSSTWDVVQYVIDRYKENDLQFDTFALLQPTSPLRTSDDIKNAYRLMNEKKGKSIVSVCEVEHSPLWMNVLREDLSLNGFLKKEAIMPRQTLPTYYRVNGAIYISDTGEFIKNHNLYHEFGYAYVMEKSRSIDIDDILDFELAEIIMKKRESS